MFLKKSKIFFCLNSNLFKPVLCMNDNVNGYGRSHKALLAKFVLAHPLINDFNKKFCLILTLQKRKF